VATRLLHVRVVSPVDVVFDGEALGLVAPAFDGKVGILPAHAPYITLLGGGALDIDLPGGGSERFWVRLGALKVEDDEVTILTEFASRERPAELGTGTSWIEPTDLEAVADPGHPLI
jgi:F-type H+-transporting ATPase subunit epsilon